MLVRQTDVANYPNRWLFAAGRDSAPAGHRGPSHLPDRQYMPTQSRPPSQFCMWHPLAIPCASSGRLFVSQTAKRMPVDILQPMCC